MIYLIFQIIFKILSYLLSFLPNLIFVGFDIAILVFGIFIYKRNSYKYGRYLIISSILSIISVSYRTLLFILENELGFSLIIYSFLSWIFFALEIISYVYLVLAVYHIYKTHQENRIEEVYA